MFCVLLLVAIKTSAYKSCFRY